MKYLKSFHLFESVSLSDEEMINEVTKIILSCKKNSFDLVFKICNILNINLSDDFIEDFFNLSWFDKYCILKGNTKIDKLFDLFSLTKLNLRNDNLTEIPKEIGLLTNLRELNISSIKLTEIPKEIGNLYNLTELFLIKTNITKLPKEIGNLYNLTYLLLFSNKLTSIPKEIGNLHNLTIIYLNHNQLPEIPKVFGGMRNLNSLLLQNNPLSQETKDYLKSLNIPELKL